MKKKKLRPLGVVMFDVEDILTEMSIDHDLQHTEVLYLIKSSLDVHFPQQKEVYEEDGSSPQIGVISYAKRR